MPIKRAEHKKDFTQILNAVSNDIRLSYGARGLMLYVLTHCDNWVFTGEEYFVTEKDRLSKIKSYLKELIQYGYLKRYQEKSSKGVFGRMMYIFYESPIIDYPLSKKPLTVKPSTENQTTVKNTNNSNVTPKIVLPLTDSPLTVQPLAENHMLNNTNINNNNIYSDFVEKIKKIYPGKKVKDIRDKKLPKILKKYSENEIIRCVERYSKECKGKDKQFILNESTFWNGRYINYLDSNYEEVETKKQEKKLSEMF